MKIKHVHYSAIGVFLLLSLLLVLPVHADDSKKQDKKTKKETKYDRLFKNKKFETAKSRFITLHKMDGKLYFELPLKYLGKEMLLGGAVSSVTDATYISPGSRSLNPIDFYFELQDSSVVMKTPNTVVYNDGKASPELQSALNLNYRDPLFYGFKVETYNNDSSAVVFDVTSLLARPNSMLGVIPTTNGKFNIKASPKSDLSYIRSIKSFDDNLCVKNEFNYAVTAMIMSVPVANELPTTIGVTYSLSLLPESKMRPRIVDSRVGIASSSKLALSSNIEKTKSTYIAHRWNLIPRDKKAYAQGKLSEPEKKITFYLDNTLPQSWRDPVRQGVLLWNQAFEQAGFKKAIEVVDCPKDNSDFDMDDMRHNSIRYIPSEAESIENPVLVNPNNGEIINGSLIISSNIAQLLYKRRVVETAATDASVRSDKFADDKFAESLKYYVARCAGKLFGLLDNPGASSAYSVDSLRNARFTSINGLSPSIMDDVYYNYVAQPSDKNVRLVPTGLGPYDKHAIEWNYKYFDTEKVTVNQEQKDLEKMVDSRVVNPRYRYYRGQTAQYDPRVAEGALGNNALKAANLGIRNLHTIVQNLPKWIKNDEDSRKKETLYLTIAQQHYAFFKQVISNVGGIFLNDMKLSSGVPRYQVVSKSKQREALLWCIHQAKQFTSYADRSFERKGFMAISYYDQLLEFIGYDIMGARKRLAVSNYLAPESYSQKEYFDDVFNGIFQCLMNGKSPTQEERILQNTYITYSRAAVNKARKSSGAGSTSLRATAATTSYGSPTSPLVPTVNEDVLDKSGLYFYSSLLRLKPMLEKVVKTNLDAMGKAHYQVMLYKVNHLLEGKQ
uniref:Zinc-dependent metalloprotease n=1 Tax=Prevotella sp. GTC17262 TaxID=3236797 RepID=A0AB33JQ52_9BACT